MKIAVLTAGFLPIPPTKGGAVENLVLNLLNENENNKKLNFEVISTYDSKAKEISKNYKYSSFIFIKTNIFVKALDKIIFFIAKRILKKQNSYKYRYILQRLSYLRKSSVILHKNDYDKVLLENHPTEYLALKWHNNYIKYANNYYYHCHNEFPSTYNCMNIIKNTKKIICVSKFRKENVKNYLKMPEYKFKVLKNGIDTSLFSPNINENEKEQLLNKYNLNKNNRILLYTGRVVPGKGIKETIMGFKKLKDNNIKLFIVGAALNKLNAKTQFEKEIEELLDDNIIFTGFVNYEEIYKFYKIADIAILPSTIEDSAPLTIIEALVSGLPIISTTSGGIPEYALENSAILLERDENLIDNITKNIKILLNDKEKLLKMSDSAKKVSIDLTKEKFYNNFCSLLLEGE